MKTKLGKELVISTIGNLFAFLIIYGVTKLFTIDTMTLTFILIALLCLSTTLVFIIFYDKILTKFNNTEKKHEEDLSTLDNKIKLTQTYIDKIHTMDDHVSNYIEEINWQRMCYLYSCIKSREILDEPKYLIQEGYRKTLNQISEQADKEIERIEEILKKNFKEIK